MTKRQGSLGSLVVDLTGAVDADGKEPAYKVHAGGTTKAKPTESSTFDDLYAVVLGSSESMVSSDYYNCFVVLMYLFGAKYAGADLFHSEVYTTHQTQQTHNPHAFMLGRV